VGDGWEPRGFCVSVPTVIAGIGQISDTLEDRSITIGLRRRLPSEKVERLRSNKTEHLEKLCRRAARWAADNLERLIDADPDFPDELNDRAQDNWRPLIAIADLISEDAGKNARRAAIAIVKNYLVEEAIGTMLLADVAAIVKAEVERCEKAKEKRPEIISTDTILDSLKKLPDRPWATWSKPDAPWEERRPISSHRVAGFLKAFELKPGRKKLEGVQVRGYATAAVLEAAARYIDPGAEEGDPVEETAGQTEAPSKPDPEDIPY
jgi:hypothetical protein